MNNYNNTSKILEAQDHHNQTVYSHQAEMQARALEQQIQLTIFNYESLLQLENKNSAERSEFLLFMIQSTRTKQQEEIEVLKAQLQAVVAQKEEAMSLEKQMESIGQGVDSIVQEGKKLKARNETLQRQFCQQQRKEKQLDQQIAACQKELEGYRQKIEEWQRTKIKWNRRKKQLLQLISQAEQQIDSKRLQTMREQQGQNEQQPIRWLMNKYKHVSRSK